MSSEDEAPRTLECPACGQEAPVSEADVVAGHTTPGGSTCPASGWTIKGGSK